MAEDVKLVLRYRVEANAPLAYQKPILLMEGDKRANVLQVSLFDGEKPVDVTGLTVGGSVLRADGADVAIEGEINGNVISCVLSEYAYAVAGPFKAFVQLLDSLGDVKRTVLLLAGMVESRGHGPQIDTGKELPSLDDILAQLETMRNVTQAANTATGDANAAAAAANSAASKATGAANSATTAAGTANAAADRANDAAQNWEDGTVKNAENLGGVPARSYALKTDTAPNAEKLANKPPEYYLTPVNLLDNSDFRNPVNTNGQTSYTAAGETINGWLLVSTGSPTCQLTDGAMVITAETASTRLRQKIASIKDGIYTFAANVGEKIATRVVDIAGTTVTAINSGNAAYTGGYVECGTADGYVAMNVFVTAGNSITVYWAALYEGSYTAESLPPYVPKGYAVEALNCGVPVHPRNLLDNSDFTNPVNQRGYTSGKELAGWAYFFDRWELFQEANATITFSKNGVSINQITIAQVLENVPGGKVYTGAIGLSDGTVICASGLVTYNADKSWNRCAHGTDAQTKASVFLDTINNTFDFVIYTYKAVSIVWACLYEGAYTAETLPTYVPKGYAAELAECKRYYQKIRFGNGYLMLYAFSDTIARTHWFIPGMRKIPSITCDIDLRLVSSSGYKVVTSYTVDGMTETGMMISMITAGLTAGEFCWTSPTSGYATIELSADL